MNIQYALTNMRSVSTIAALMTTTRGICGLAILTTCLIAGSCSIYNPKPYIPKSAFKNQYLQDVTSPTLLQVYNALPRDSDIHNQAKVMRRNQILQELIALIDDNYYVFEAKYYGSDATVNFAGDVANLGLTGVSSVTGTARLKAVLSAIATGETGIKTSYEKNFYDQQTRSAVVERMRAGRATQLATIEDQNHMKAPVVCPVVAGCPAVGGVAIAPYSLESGLSDVAAYYNAGTIIGALQAISAAAGTDTTTAQTNQKKNSVAQQIY